MGVATLVRKAVKPVAVVGVTGLLSFSMIAMTSEQAEALVPPVAPIIEGATEAILPEVMATEASVGPVGWALLGLTVLAASTQDYWMPWVAGQFGMGNTNTANPSTGTYAKTPGGYDIKPLTGFQLGAPGLNPADPHKIDLPWSVTGYPTGSSASFHIAYRLTCVMDQSSYNNSDGTRIIDSFATYGSDPIPDARTISPICMVSDNYGDHYGKPWRFQAGIAGGSGLPSFPNDPFFDRYPSGPTNNVWWGNGAMNSFDPKSTAVTYHTTVECIAKDGTKATITADSTGDAGAIKVPSCAAAGLGRATGKMDVTSDNPNQNGQTMFHQSAPGVDTSHPLCDPTLAGPLCKLQILVDGKPCVEGQVECVRWAQLAKSDPTRVQCFYGPYQVAMSNCSMLERAYEIGGAVSNVPNTDGDPATRSGTGPSGQPQPVPEPGADPGTTPRAGPGTTPGVGTTPGAAGAPTGTMAPAERDCFPNGWAALNPVEWVVHPLQCAFEPSQASKDAVNEVPNRFNSRAPFSWMAGASAMVAGSSAIGSGGCPNWTVTVGSFSKNVVCDSSFTAAIVGTRGSLLGLLIVAMFWPFIRSMWYAVIPILRPTPMA